MTSAVSKHIICIPAFKFGILNRYLLSDSQDGWGASVNHIWKPRFGDFVITIKQSEYTASFHAL